MFTISDTILVQFPLDALSACGLGSPMLVPSGDVGSPLLEPETLEAFNRLAEQALQDGFVLRIESGYRPFSRQLSIWNRKALGQLPLLDGEGAPLERSSLNDAQCLDAILDWSALPGTSRHHWGTDLDVVDAAAIPPGYEVALTPAESDGDGVFAPLHRWLDARFARGEAFGFRRVFEPGRGRVRPERWHLSYAPAARRFEAAFDTRLLPPLFEACGLELREEVLRRLPFILSNYVTCYFQHPPQSFHD